MEDVLKRGYYEFLLDYVKVDWCTNENINLERKIAFFFKNTEKDIIMTEEDEENIEIINICRFFEKKLNLIKLEIIIT